MPETVSEVEVPADVYRIGEGRLAQRWKASDGMEIGVFEADMTMTSDPSKPKELQQIDLAVRESGGSWQPVCSLVVGDIFLELLGTCEPFALFIHSQPSSPQTRQDEGTPH